MFIFYALFFAVEPCLGQSLPRVMVVFPAMGSMYGGWKVARLPGCGLSIKGPVLWFQVSGLAVPRVRTCRDVLREGHVWGSIPKWHEMIHMHLPWSRAILLLAQTWKTETRNQACLLLLQKRNQSWTIIVEKCMCTVRWRQMHD